MEELSTRIQSLKPLFRARYPPREGSYHFDEEADCFGFSCMAAANRLHSRTDSQNNNSKSNHEDSSEQTHTVLDLFRNDENWNNPGGVELMMRSYDLTDCAYSSLTLSAIPNGDRPAVERLNYLEVKASQYRMIAMRKTDEAMVLLQKNRIADAIALLSEAIRLDDGNVNSFFLRAKAYSSLMEYGKAETEILAALKLTPDVPALLELQREITSKMQQSRAPSANWREREENTKRLKLSHSFDDQRRGGGGGEFDERHEYVSESHVETIEKLRASLAKPLTSRSLKDSDSDSGSDSSDSDSDSDSSSDSSRDSRRRKHKKSHRSKSKRKKDKKKKKSKKSKHKRKRSSSE